MPKNEDDGSEKEGKLDSEAQPTATTPPPSKVTPTKNASPLRQFEGGFFQIASPLRSSNKNHASNILHSPRVNGMSLCCEINIAGEVVVIAEIIRFFCSPKVQYQSAGKSTFQYRKQCIAGYASCQKFHGPNVQSK